MRSHYHNGLKKFQIFCNKNILTLFSELCKSEGEEASGCFNGGSCELNEDDNTYACKCREQYTGKNCELCKYFTPPSSWTLYPLQPHPNLATIPPYIRFEVNS